MASDNLKTEYHLTPNGWVEGTITFFNKPQGEEVARPADAVETWVYQIYQPSEWSSEERSWTLIWRSSSVNEDTAKETRSKFPKPEEDFPSDE